MFRSRAKLSAAIITTMLATTVAAVILVVSASDDQESPNLGGASLLADGGSYPGQGESLLVNDDVDLQADDLRLTGVSRIAGDGSEAFWMYAHRLDPYEHPEYERLIHAESSGTVIGIGGVQPHVDERPDEPVSRPAWMGNSTRSAIGFGGNRQTEVMVFDDSMAEYRVSTDRGDFYDLVGRGKVISMPFPVASVAMTEDGTLLVSARGDGLLAAYQADGDGESDDGGPAAQLTDDDVEYLLDSSDIPDSAGAEDGPGEILDIEVLNDGRLALAAVEPAEDSRDDDTVQLWLLDGDDLSRLETGDADPAHNEISYNDDGYVVDLTMEPLAPGPDGTLLATGLTGADETPTITQVDPDSGDVDTLVEMDGITPTHELPTSVAAVGDDLIFLADGKLWILEDAFA